MGAIITMLLALIFWSVMLIIKISVYAGIFIIKGINEFKYNRELKKQQQTNNSINVVVN